ncbi:MAG: flavodoxin domain-containing protein, partial [bacterium]
AFEGVLAKNVAAPADYAKAMKYYFETIMAPFKKFVLRALDRIKDLPIRYVATGHGPVVDETNLEITKSVYADWAMTAPKPTIPRVVIAYASAYGYTEKMAFAIHQGIEAAFAGQVLVELHDLVTTKTEDVIASIETAQGFLIGSTTILGDTLPPVWDLLARLNPQLHGGKFASGFGSYGWSGEAVFHIINRLGQLKMKTIEGLRIRFNPSEDQRREAQAFGVRFSDFMQGKT